MTVADEVVADVEAEVVSMLLPVACDVVTEEGVLSVGLAGDDAHETDMQRSRIMLRIRIGVFFIFQPPLSWLLF